MDTVQPKTLGEALGNDCPEIHKGAMELLKTDDFTFFLCDSIQRGCIAVVTNNCISSEDLEKLHKRMSKVFFHSEVQLTLIIPERAYIFTSKSSFCGKEPYSSEEMEYQRNWLSLALGA